MLANVSADAAHRFQPFQPSSELVEKVDQPNQPKTDDSSRTRPKNSDLSVHLEGRGVLQHQVMNFTLVKT